MGDLQLDSYTRKTGLWALADSDRSDLSRCSWILHRLSSIGHPWLRKFDSILCGFVCDPVKLVLDLANAILPASSPKS